MSDVNTTKLNLADLTALVLSLQARVEELEKANQPKPKVESVEMTDDHARRIMNGDLKDKSHKDAAAALNLTYGQVYSCRLGYTFKAIHKELGQISGYTNRWVK